MKSISRKQFLLQSALGLGSVMLFSGFDFTSTKTDADFVIGETTFGKVRGIRERGVNIFKGIPYGGSVSGDYRFARPAALEPLLIGPGTFFFRNCFIQMARIFITGSSDGLGSMSAKLLVAQGHEVVLHARNAERGRLALEKVPGTKIVLIGDLSSIEETKKLAAEVNKLGHFDAIIHNAGVYQVSNKLIFAVNTLAPYILTCLIQRPERLIYLSSGMHLQGDPGLKDFSHDISRYSYSDSKLHVVILSMAAARKWPGVYSNAVNPGWVPTKMGGRSAPDNLEKGAETQAWLAVSNDKEAKVSGRYFYHMREKPFLPEAGDPVVQERFLALCEEISGVSFPAY